jgi:hypothetical protein
MHFGLDRLTSICKIKEKLEYGSIPVFGFEYEVSDQNYHIDWQVKLMPHGSEVVNVGCYWLALKISSS